MPRCRYRSAVLVSFVCGDSFADVQVRCVAERTLSRFGRSIARRPSFRLSLAHYRFRSNRKKR